MKPIIIIYIFIFSANVFAQSGIYERMAGSETTENRHVWTLTLNPDGTFLYHVYRKLKGGIPPEENFYGKGKWKSERNLIYFTANPDEDIDETHKINLNAAKARINSKSPRDKSDRMIKTSIRFYESDLQTIKGLELYKKEP